MKRSVQPKDDGDEDSPTSSAAPTTPKRKKENEKVKINAEKVKMAAAKNLAKAVVAEKEKRDNEAAKEFAARNDVDRTQEDDQTDVHEVKMEEPDGDFDETDGVPGGGDPNTEPTITAIEMNEEEGATIQRQLRHENDARTNIDVDILIHPRSEGRCRDDDIIIEKYYTMLSSSVIETHKQSKRILYLESEFRKSERLQKEEIDRLKTEYDGRLQQTKKEHESETSMIKKSYDKKLEGVHKEKCEHEKSLTSKHNTEMKAVTDELERVKRETQEMESKLKKEVISQNETIAKQKNTIKALEERRVRETSDRIKEERDWMSLVKAANEAENEARTEISLLKVQLAKMQTKK